MKILFEIGLPSHIRHYDNVVEELQKRGHEVTVVASLENPFLLEKRTVEKDHRNVSSNILFLLREPWAELGYLLRCTRDFIHYQRPEYDKSNVLRGRITNMLRHGLSDQYSEAGKSIEDFVRGLPQDKQQQFSDVLAKIDAALPISTKITKKLRRHGPDIYLITPLIFTQYGQFEFLKCAKTLGIPTGYMVFSWDNISTKGILQTMPDAIFVWNQRQKEEIGRFYKVSLDDVYICGAPRFDYFFKKKPSLSRSDFCHRYSLQESRPIITYLCSSNLVSTSESEFVAKWLDELDAAESDIVRTCNVVIRPHPKFREQWAKCDFGKRSRSISICGSDRLNNDQLLFDTLYYSSAVVGLNTSAQLEAAVLGKPVLTIKVPEYSNGQEGTIHFHYLLKENGGFVERSDSIPDHVRKLIDILSNRYDKNAITNFVEKFVRPQGMNKSAARATAEAIEMFGVRHKRELKRDVVARRRGVPPSADILAYLIAQGRRIITKSINSL